MIYMKKMLSATLAFGLICMPAVCSEVSTEVSDRLVLQVKLEGNFKNGSRKLTLLGVNEVADISRVWSSMVRRHNQPFFPVTVQKQENISRVQCVAHENCFIEKEQLEGISCENYRGLTYLPVQYFDEAGKFRSHGAVMYSGWLDSGDGHMFNLSLEFDSDLELGETLEAYVNEFEKNPCYFENDQQELLFFGLLEKKDETIIHGKNAFNAIPFSSEEANGVVTMAQEHKDLLAQQKTNDKIVAEKTQLVSELRSAISSYRKGFIGFSAVFAILMLYILHDKFHDTLYATA